MYFSFSVIFSFLAIFHIRKKSDVEYKYKKQSGGHGQYGHVKMTFEPSGDLEVPYTFEQQVVGGAVPKNYFPAVEKGLQESVLKGQMRKNC